MATATALSTLTYCDYSLEQALDGVASHGFERVDIAHMSYYSLHFDVGVAPERHIRELLEERGLRAVALNYFGGDDDPGKPHGPRLPRAPHRLHRDEEVAHYVPMMRGVLEQARALGISTVASWPGRRSEAPDKHEEFSAAARVIGQLADEAAGTGLQVVVEAPHCFSLLHSVDTVESFMSQTSSNVGLLVDCSHWGVLRYDLDDLFARVGDRVAHVHLRDSRGLDTNDFQQVLELTPGRGVVDFGKFGAALDRLGYTSEVTMELEYKGRPLDAIAEEVRFAIAFLRRVGWEVEVGSPARV